jgi:hypothetical protein
LLHGTRIDSVSAAQQALDLPKKQRDRVQVTLAQADHFDGALDPLSDANLRALVFLAFQVAPFPPQAALMAAPSHPGRAIKLPEHAFGVNDATRVQRFHAIFLGGQGGEALPDGTLPHGWEAPMTAQSRPAETDTYATACRAGRAASFDDPLNYVLRFAGATMRSFDHHAPAGARGLPLVITMGRRDQVVMTTRQKQDHHGDTLAAHPRWGSAVRDHLGRRRTIVEVGDPQRLGGGGLHPHLHLLPANGDPVSADLIEDFTLYGDAQETILLPGLPGGLVARMFRGVLKDTETGEPAILLSAGTAAGEFSTTLFFAIPYLKGLDGSLSVRPDLENPDEGLAVAAAIRHYVLPNPYVGGCRRSSFLGSDYLFNPTRDVASRELAFRLGGVVRMAYTPLPWMPAPVAAR